MSFLGIDDRISDIELRGKTVRKIIKSKDIEAIRSLLAIRDSSPKIGKIHFDEEVNILLDKIVRHSPTTFPGKKPKFSEVETSLIYAKRRLAEESKQKRKKAEEERIENERKKKEENKRNRERREEEYRLRDEAIEAERLEAEMKLMQAQFHEAQLKYSTWGNWQ